MGSNTVLEVGGKKIRGRKYPWGIVEGDYITLLQNLQERSFSIWSLDYLVLFCQNHLKSPRASSKDKLNQRF